MRQTYLLWIFLVVVVASGANLGKGQAPSSNDAPTPAAAFFESVVTTADDILYLVHFNLQTNLAWAHFQEGERDKAFVLINQVVEAAEDQAPLYQAAALAWRAKLYALAFDYDAAVNDMNTAIDLEPIIPAFYALRGQYVLLTYEWDQVLADYNQAIALDPDYADAYFLRGVLFYTQGPRENALEDFDHYLELTPDGLYAEEATQYSELLRVEFAALDD